MEVNETLNILEQRTVWERLVTNLALCFQSPNNKDVPLDIAKLQNAFDQVASSFPWLAGQVVNEGRDLANGNTGVLKIIPRREKPRIIVKDHRQTSAVPDLRTLREQGFPAAMLDEAILAPRSGFVMDQSKEKPVLLIQANILSGGIILVFSGCHAAMDMPGQSQIMRWFSKACHEEALTAAELEVGNMSRRNVIPLLDGTYPQGDELKHQVPPTPTAGLQLPRVPCEWATFTVSRQAVAEIKAIAMASRTTPYISTDDALSAFVWQSVARARRPRLEPVTVSTAIRAVDARKALGIPQAYPGLVQNNTFHKLSLHELENLPPGAVASSFRNALTSSSPDLAFYTRALATALSCSNDKSSLRVSAQVDLSSDLILSSFLSTEAQYLDFALDMGLPEAVRLTKSFTFESMTYLYPNTPNGEITLVICLRHEDLAALRTDAAFGAYAQYAG